MPAAAEPAASREDLLALIAVLREQKVALAERSALLEEQNAALAERCERREGEDKQLRARVAELEWRLNRNSGNSNFPPSQDVFGLPPPPHPGPSADDAPSRPPHLESVPGRELREGSHVHCDPLVG